ALAPRVATGQPRELPRVRLEEQPVPPLLVHEPGAVTLLAGLDADLDEVAGVRADAAEDLLQDAVLAVLRVHAALVRPQVSRRHTSGSRAAPGRTAATSHRAPRAADARLRKTRIPRLSAGSRSRRPRARPAGRKAALAGRRAGRSTGAGRCAAARAAAAGRRE